MGRGSLACEELFASGALGPSWVINAVGPVTVFTLPRFARPDVGVTVRCVAVKGGLLLPAPSS